MLQDASHKSGILIHVRRTDEGRKRAFPDGYRGNIIKLACAAIVLSAAFRQVWQLRSWNGSRADRHDRTAAFNWGHIKPTQTLQYHACFDGYECARLEVPLNWNRTADEENINIAIAIMKKPARVPVTDPRYGGLVIFNPGGPGNSGVQFMLKYGVDLQFILDNKADITAIKTQGKYFDVMSFDPRGVNNTTPVFSCFPDLPSRLAWDLQRDTIGAAINSNESFRQAWAYLQAQSNSCSNVHSAGGLNTVSNGEHLGEYVSTASVVRDMVEMIERHGEWREKSAVQLLSKSTLKDSASEKVLNRTAWQRGREQLQFWGFSYGSYLGQTFASMQPHRVKRIVVDGVVDAADYARTGWAKNANDVEEILNLFFTSCFDAGPKRCELYSDAGPREMQHTFNQVMKTIQYSPLRTWNSKGPSIITYKDVIGLIFSAFYTPLNDFTKTAHLLADVSRGNGSSFAALKAQSHTTTCPSLSPAAAAAEDRDSSTLSIVCGDGESIYGEAQEKFLEYVAYMNTLSPTFGTFMSAVHLSCIGWSVRPKWRFAGPFGTDKANPILFAGQLLDPVTPLKNAISGAKLFPGSSVLKQNGVGHCTLSSPSVCTAKAIREYFQTGALPEKGSICGVDVRPFWQNDEDGYERRGKLEKTLRKIADTFPH